MKNELMETNNTGFLALQDFDLANVMSEEMDGLSATFERVKIPSGGGIMFEIPGDNPDEPETVKEFSAVILYQHSLNAYYESEYQGGSNPPDCGSYDGHNGEGDPGGNCDVMQDNLAGQVTILKSQLEELAISFGEILMPAIREIVAKIQGFIDKQNQLDPATKETIIKIALIAAALGPLLIAVGKTISTVGHLMTFISNIPTMIAGAKAAFTALSGVIGGISAPVVAVIAAIAALVAAFVHLWNTNEDFRNNILAVWEKIKATFSNLTQGIVDRLNALGFNFEDFGDMVKKIWQGLCDILAPWFEGVFTYISEIFDVVVDTILGVLDVFIGLFTGDWEQCWSGIKGIFVGIWDFIKNIFSNFLNTLEGIADVFFGWFGTSWSEVWTSIKNFFVGIWNSITTFVTGIFTSIQNFFTTI